MATEMKQPVRSLVLEISDLPKHLQESKGWLASLQVEALSFESKIVLLKVWRRVNGKAVETTITLREEETLTFVDGDKE